MRYYNFVTTELEKGSWGLTGMENVLMKAYMFLYLVFSGLMVSLILDAAGFVDLEE